jgi:hypothetical protein
MTRSDPPIIDMRPDGSFAGSGSSGPRFSGARFSGARFSGPGFTGVRLGGLAALAVFAAMTLAMVVFFVWLLIWLIPIALGTALITYAALRVRRWWLGQSAAPPSVFGVWNQHGK